MSIKTISRVSRKLQLLDRKMDILRHSIKESFQTTLADSVFNRDIPEEEINREYSNWKQDLLIRYYDPRRK